MFERVQVEVRIRSRLICAALLAALAPTSAAASPLHSAAEIERATETFLECKPTPGSRRAGGGIDDARAAVSLPEARVVALYGAPQMGATILGLKAPRAAAARLAKQSRPY